MKIKVRLFATLRDGRGKEVEVERGESFSTLDILEELKIRREEVALFLINGRDGSFETQLSEGDVVSLFPPVGGG
ncbi:MAG: MoaD/ThiS family protein [Clostridia bacterium]|nr:MoaD/ThiS family protein [Clostridia bacterium]